MCILCTMSCFWEIYKVQLYCLVKQTYAVRVPNFARPWHTLISVWILYTFSLCMNVYSQILWQNRTFFVNSLPSWIYTHHFLWMDYILQCRIFIRLVVLNVQTIFVLVKFFQPDTWQIHPCASHWYLGRQILVFSTGVTCKYNF